MLRGATGNVLPAGGTGVLFMDVRLDKGATIPKTLKHRFKIAVARTPGAESLASGLPAGPGHPGDGPESGFRFTPRCRAS
jgi:hypothetical protein